MPRQQATISWQQLRILMEQWEWRDARTGAKVSGLNPPADALERQQKPFYFRAITGSGEVIAGQAICLKVFLRQHQRLVKFTASGEMRRIRDYLVIEVNGIRVITH